MNLSKSFLILLATTGIATHVAVAQEGPSQIALTQGAKFKITNLAKTSISQEMMGQTMEMAFDVNTTQSVNVKEKKASSYVLNTSVTQMKMSGSMMGQELNFDSDKKEDLNSDIGKSLKEMLNKPADVELDPTAKVINAPKTTKKEGEGNPMTQMINNFGSQDDSYGTKTAFEVFPKGKKVGDTWSDSTITDEMKTYRTFTLKSIGKEESTFSFTGTQVISKKTETQGMEVLVSMEGKLTGDGTVSNATGMVKQRTVVSEATGSAEVMGNSIPMTTKVTVTTTIVPE